MRYFVTGATGFIGGRVARQLIDAGHEVIALVRSRSRAKDLIHAGMSICEGDITSKESLRAAMDGVDGVFHLAAWYKLGTRDKKMASAINVDGTRNVLQIMRELSIPRGVYTSTITVFSDTHGKIVDESYRHEGPWLTEYDRTKWIAHYQIAEPMIRDGLPLVIVQPGANYGPGDTSSIRDVFVRYLKGKLPVVPDKVAYCWAHVDDTARGHILAMEKGRSREAYIIAGPPHTLTETFAIAERITGISAPRVRLSPRTLRITAGLMGVIDRIVPVPESFSSEALRVLAGVTYLGSSAKAQRELGFTARPLEEGLQETLSFELQALRAKSSK